MLVQERSGECTKSRFSLTHNQRVAGSSPAGPTRKQKTYSPKSQPQIAKNGNCAHFCAQSLVKLSHEAAFLAWTLTAAGSGFVEMASRARCFRLRPDMGVVGQHLPGYMSGDRHH